MDKRPILLVEDNPDDVALTLRAFKKNHIANPIQIARDGVEALEYLFGEGAATKPLPALVLLDLKMPRLGGLEVLARIRTEERTKVLQVVVLTSSREDDDLMKSYSLHANSYIRKPIDFEEFIRAVGQIGLYWLLLNQPPPAKS